MTSSTITTTAAVMWEPGKSWDLVELTIDPPKAQEVLIRFEVSGICHSDDHLRTGDWPVRYPIVGGHEGSGVIEAVGPNVSRVAVGDRVVCSFIPVCGTCRWCSSGRQNLCDQGLNASTGALTDDTFRFHSGDQEIGGACVLGTFSRRAVISEHSCVKLPDSIPFEVGALLGCGVPTGWGSAVHAAGVGAGDVVVIYGSGGVGSNAVQGAAHAGARLLVVVDPVELKRKTALHLGATHAFATHEEAHEFVVDRTLGQLADHAIITVGVNRTSIVDQAASIIGKNGAVVVVAMGKAGENLITMNTALLQGYQQRIQGNLFGSCNPLVDVPRLISMYQEGQLKLDELISNRYTLADINTGFTDMLEGRNIRGIIVHTEDE